MGHWGFLSQDFEIQYSSDFSNQEAKFLLETKLIEPTVEFDDWMKELLEENKKMEEIQKFPEDRLDLSVPPLPEVFNKESISPIEQPTRIDSPPDLQPDQFLLCDSPEIHSVRQDTKCDRLSKMVRQGSHLIQPYNLWWRKTRIKVARGVPQGGKSSPLLFVLVLDTAIRTFETKYQKPISQFIKIYADDMVVIFSKRDNIQYIKELFRQHLYSFGLKIMMPNVLILTGDNLNLISKLKTTLNIQEWRQTKTLRRTYKNSSLIQTMNLKTLILDQQYIYSKFSIKICPILTTINPADLQKAIILIKQKLVSFTFKVSTFLRIFFSNRLNTFDTASKHLEFFTIYNILLRYKLHNQSNTLQIKRHIMEKLGTTYNNSLIFVGIRESDTTLPSTEGLLKLCKTRPNILSIAISNQQKIFGQTFTCPKSRNNFQTWCYYHILPNFKERVSSTILEIDKIIKKQDDDLENDEDTYYKELIENQDKHRLLGHQLKASQNRLIDQLMKIYQKHRLKKD